MLKINCSWRLLLSYGDNIYLWGNLTTASGSLKLSSCLDVQAVKLDLKVQTESTWINGKM